MNNPVTTRFTLLAATAAFAIATTTTLQAQTWQLVDTFAGGVPQGTWNSVGTSSFKTAEGFLDLRPSEGSNVTATVSVALPQSFTSGKLTVAFDYYLPSGIELNMAGFGVGSTAQSALSGWGATGNRNRFQSVGNPSPQNMAKVPNWDSDIFGTTEQGVWYNVWLVYDLDASPKTVTAHTKRAGQAMEPENLIVSPFDFDATNNDDWSSIDIFAVGIGLQDVAPAGTEAWDALGSLVDNIYVSTGENITEKPTTVAPGWIKVDTFAGGGTEATWTSDPALSTTFEGDSLMITGTAANAGMYTALPIDSIRTAFTVTFDLLLPGGAGPNNIQFAVVGEEQVALTGTALFGGSDRFVTQPGQDPQPLARFGEWPSVGGPDLLGGTVEDQWYHVWIVYDGSSSTMDFYAVPVSNPVESVTLPTEPAGSFTLATDYTGLGYFVIGTGFLANGNGVKIDNLYQSIGANVSLSPTAGDVGGGGGDPVSLWAALPDIGGGYKATGIGLLNDAHYPYVWHFLTGGYFYIADEYSDLDSIWGLDLTNNYWFWADDALGGWHYNITDSSWAAWTK